MRGLIACGLVAAWLVATGCGRTALEPFQAPPVDAAQPVDRPADLGIDAPYDVPPDAPPDTPPDMPPDLGMDVPPDRGMDMPPDHGMDGTEPPQDAPPACQPKPETCNGLDDDCDGAIDEDQPAIPCPDGGNRYCVGGRYSDCPRRCDVCVPGSKRTCITSYCTYWGSQTCSADGRSFSRCDESRPPPECEKVAQKMMKSPELEMCCLEAGHCCVDEFDLNNNGDRTEMLGRCDAVVCDR